MTKPFDPSLTSSATPPLALPAGPEAPIDNTGAVKNWQRSPARRPARLALALAALLASLVGGALTPGDALADEGDDQEEVARPPARKPSKDPTQGLKKIQEVIAKAQAEKAAKDKAAKEKDKPGAAGKDKPGAKDKAAKKEPTLEERALRGVVVIERGGQPIGLGAALAADGRILTALSPLGSGNDLEVRFADGTTVKAKLGHHDRMWDLALLVPQTGKWQEGLTASGRDPVRQDASIKSFSATAKGKAPSAGGMTLRGYRSLIGGDDKPLDQAIELGSRVMPNDLGSPIIDEEGRVVAVLGRGCAPNEGRPCTPVAFGIPISAIKGFLRSVPPTAVPPAAWLGIQGIAEAGGVAKGVRVMVVHPESPADEAQLKGGERGMGDMILAVDGVPVTSPEALADAIRTHAVGEKVPLTIFSQGKYKQVTVNLRAAPGPRSASAAPPAHPAELPALPEAPPGPPGGPRHR
ncbi:MAG TPA: S1C family serine protease [Polyangiaceae bacterium]|jgi:serine protease Do|nr:S1C family serine protease [Polyangiaceae bacterium]